MSPAEEGGTKGYEGEEWKAPEFDPEKTKGAYPDDAKKARKFMVKKDLNEITEKAKKIKPDLAEDIKVREPYIPNLDHDKTDSEKPWYGTKDEELK